MKLEQKYPGATLFVAWVVTMVLLMLHIAETGYTSDNMLNPNGPNASVSGSTDDINIPTGAYLNPKTGYITRLLMGKDVLFSEGYASEDAYIDYSFDRSFGGSQDIKMPFDSIVGPKTTLDVSYGWSILGSAKMSELVHYYNKHIAHPGVVDATPGKLFPDLDTQILNYVQPLVADAVAKGKLDLPNYTKSGDIVAVSDGGGGTCNQLTVVSSNTLKIADQIKGVLGSTTIFNTFVSPSQGYITVPDTDNCMMRIDQALHDVKGA